MDNELPRLDVTRETVYFPQQMTDDYPPKSNLGGDGIFGEVPALPMYLGGRPYIGEITYGVSLYNNLFIYLLYRY